MNPSGVPSENNDKNDGTTLWFWGILKHYFLLLVKPLRSRVLTPNIQVK
jgi:hypothetical protein